MRNDDLPMDYGSSVMNADNTLGLTETCTVVSSSLETDIWLGSSGSLVPSINAKIISLDGVEITGYDQPGELVVQSPSVVLGYLNNDKANAETFLPDMDGHGRWMRTGDEAVFRKGHSGTEHIFIVDRIKELIKVKVFVGAIID
jgi:long-subunit acyl-CoA synthetase (AMP-forming)